MSEQEKVPFYKKTWFIILTLIFIFPVGLYLMWAHTDWNKKAKWVVTAIVALFALSTLFGEGDTTNEIADSDNEQVASEESEPEEAAPAEEEPEASEEEPVEEEAEEEEVEEPEEELTEEDAEIAEGDPEEVEADIEESEVDEETAEVETEESEEEETEITYEMIDGIAVFTDATEPVISTNNMLNVFSNDMANNLKAHHEDIENGAIFRLANTLMDDYGNEEQVYTVVVYYSQDTIERIDYDNWPRLTASGLYDTADGVLLHYALGDVDHAEPKTMDDPPSLFVGSFGATHEE